jgi:hypothetical protein
MDHWILVKKRAMKCMQTNKVWYSFIQEKPYRVLNVEPNKILIKKVDGGNDVSLTKKTSKQQSQSCIRALPFRNKIC